MPCLVFKLDIIRDLHSEFTCMHVVIYQRQIFKIYVSKVTKLILWIDWGQNKFPSSLTLVEFCQNKLCLILTSDWQERIHGSKWFDSRVLYCQLMFKTPSLSSTNWFSQNVHYKNKLCKHGRQPIWEKENWIQTC